MERHTPFKIIIRTIDRMFSIGQPKFAAKSLNSGLFWLLVLGNNCGLSTRQKRICKALSEGGTSGFACSLERDFEFPLLENHLESPRNGE